MALLGFGRSATRASLDALPATILVVRVRGAQPPACVCDELVSPLIRHWPISVFTSARTNVYYVRGSSLVHR